MRLPSNIDRASILQAIERIDKEGVPSDANSRYYDVLFNSKKYPPKLLVSYANKFVNGTELDRNSFDGGENKEAFHLLKKEGFLIIKKNNPIMSLPRIFISPRSGEQSAQNFAKTIDGGYQKSELLEFLSQEDKVNLQNEETLMIWGVKPSLESRWNKMQVDDWVIFYQNGNITYVGKLLYKTRNKTLADILWGPIKDENGSLLSWEFVFFVKDLRQINLSYRVMADLAGYKGAVVQGFQPYSELGVQNIINNYESIENFFFNTNIKNEKNMTLNFTVNSHINYVRAIKTKPFIILAGLSGTGKSRIVRTLAYKSCKSEALRNNKSKPGNFELIPVKPNWHDSTELMGYISRVGGEKYITTTFLKFIAKAWMNLDIPFFLCLDEMNLAPVEQYFAEYLSIIETRHLKNGSILTDFIISKESFENENLYRQILKDLGLENNELFSEGISIPSNLVVVGTVNMDETTHSFSRKVLDRAMTIEMNTVDLNSGLQFLENDWDYPQNEEDYIQKDEILGTYTSGFEVVDKYEESEKVLQFLERINYELEGTSFKIAYRVRDEFLIYCLYAKNIDNGESWLTDSLDNMVYMKILSRIEGDEAKTADVLKGLKNILDEKFKKSNNKLKEMEARLQKSGYTSFWA